MHAASSHADLSCGRHGVQCRAVGDEDTSCLGKQAPWAAASVVPHTSVLHLNLAWGNLALLNSLASVLHHLSACGWRKLRHSSNADRHWTALRAIGDEDTARPFFSIDTVGKLVRQQA